MSRRAPLVLFAFSMPAFLLGAAPPRSLADCEARVRERPEDLGAYRCFWIVARQNHQEEAKRSLERLLWRDPLNQRARLYLARIEADQGRDSAETLYHAAAAGFAGRSDAAGEVLARLGLAYFYGQRGRIPLAEKEVAVATQVAQTREDPELRARVRTEQGGLAYRRENYSAAWRILKEVESVIFPNGPLDLQAACLTRLAAVCVQMGRPEEAMRYYLQEAALREQDGDWHDAATARGNIVLLALRQARGGELDWATAGRLAQDFLSAARAGGNLQAEARAHLYLGHVGSGLEAREHYRRSLEIGRLVKAPELIVYGLRSLAMSLVEVEPRDPEEAYRLVDEALAAARGSGNRYDAALTWVSRAYMRWGTGPREQAVADSLSALGAIETARDVQQDEMVRARVFSPWTFAYQRLVGRLLRGSAGPPSPEDLELAFSVTERMRARVLLDELDAAHATGLLSRPGPVRERRNSVLKEIAQVQRGLMKPNLPEAERQRVFGVLERLEMEETASRAEFARADPVFAALRRPDLPSLAEIRAALAEDEALLSFQVATRVNRDGRTTEHGSWLWVHTRAGTRVYPLPDSDDLKPAVELLLGLFGRRDGSEVLGAPRLYRTLLGRALDELSARITRLVIVPDGVLNRLPFDGLRSGASAPPLGARYQISIVPSATLWLRWRRHAPPGPGQPLSVLAMADPELPEGVAAIASERAWNLAVPPGRLPYARQEAQYVVRRLGKGSQLRVGREASERFLKQADLRHFGVLHFATHALVDENHPDRSAVLLAPGSKEEDGLLQIRDIVGLDLSGRVIVLSACQSASGALLEGEGVMSLARAFFQAGARAVVGSLWPLRDDEAEQLVRDFYRGLAQGRSVSAALAAARRDLIRKGAPAAAWAGLVVLGDGDAVPFPGGQGGFRFAPSFLAFLVPVLVLVGMGVYRVRRSVSPPR